MTRSLALASLFSLLLAASSPMALAQDSGAIYRGVDAQGKTVFSNNPKDMRNPKKIQVSAPMVSGVEPYPVAPPTSSPAPAPAPGQSAPEPASSARSAATDAEEQPLSPTQAIDRLEAAKAAQIAGLEPLPGERTGTANGGTRLNPSYEIRQRELAAAVAAAKKAHDAALAR